MHQDPAREQHHSSRAGPCDDLWVMADECVEEDQEEGEGLNAHSLLKRDAGGKHLSPLSLSLSFSFFPSQTQTHDHFLPILPQNAPLHWYNKSY